MKPRVKRTPISDESKESRRPIPPGVAVDALHGSIARRPARITAEGRRLVDPETILGSKSFQAHIRARAPNRRSKYGVRTDAIGKAERTYKGVTYHSKAEARYASRLDLLVKAGEIVRWERQVRYLFRPHDRCPRCLIDPPGAYVADFVVTPPTGRIEVHEVKGYENREWKRKKKLFEAFYPDVKLVVVK